MKIIRFFNTSPLWQPKLDGTNGANYIFEYNENDGEGVGKGFVFKGGFPNKGLWQLSYELQHDNIRYTGLAYIADPDKYNGEGSNEYALTTWEGNWLGSTNYAHWYSGKIPWFDITVTKIDRTHVQLDSDVLNKHSTYEWTKLPLLKTISCGARHNHVSSEFGPCRIRNVVARSIWFEYKTIHLRAQVRIPLISFLFLIWLFSINSQATPMCYDVSITCFN